MLTSQSDFSGEADFEAMAALSRAFPDDNLHITDLPYRFSSWALDAWANARLWRASDGRLLAWAVLQAPFWAIDCACHPEAGKTVHRAVWAWADARARALAGTPGGLPAWFVSAFADRPGRIRELEEAGFACQSGVGEDAWSKVWMHRSAQVPVAERPAPEGYILRPLAGEAEVAAYVELQREVFGTKNMTVAWRSRTLRRPEHLPELDLVAVAPDGRLAAFCIGWLDTRAAGGTRGQIEPMGVREEARGMGLGGAILSEVLRRLVRHGARELFVETDNDRDAALALYESVGFRVVRDVWVFRKEYAEERGG